MKKITALIFYAFSYRGEKAIFFLLLIVTDYRKKFRKKIFA